MVRTYLDFRTRTLPKATPRVNRLDQEDPIRLVSILQTLATF